MLLKEKPKLFSTNGDWDVLYLNGESCCHGAASVTDTIVITIRYKRRGTQRLWRFEDWRRRPKGASRVAGSTVTVVRLGKFGDRRMAKPCDNCMAELKRLEVKYVIYSTDGGWERERVT